MTDRTALLRRVAANRQRFDRALTVELDTGVVEALRVAADIRGIRPSTLVRRLVEIVVDEDLLEPLLDDADEVEAISDAREARRRRAGGFARPVDA